MLRCSRIVAGRSLERLPSKGRIRTCSLSTTSTTSTQKQPIIVSRRAWNEYKKKHPTPPGPPKPKEETKPWPRNWQIAGYVAAAVGIPYAFLWFVATNKDAREVIVEQYAPFLEEPLRNHFGETEHDEVSYVDAKSKSMTAHYVLPDEWPYAVRCEQEQVQHLQQSSLPVKISLIAKNNPERPLVTFPSKFVSGNTIANPQELTRLVQQEAKEYMMDIDAGELQVAVDFGDLTSEKDTCESPQDLATVLHDTKSPSVQQQLYSSWHYQAPKPHETNSGRMSDVDVEISRLEYEVHQLQTDLRNVNCTRDVDDMQQELRQAKSELAKHKWKRRLRLV